MKSPILPPLLPHPPCPAPPPSPPPPFLPPHPHIRSFPHLPLPLPSQRPGNNVKLCDISPPTSPLASLPPSLPPPLPFDFPPHLASPPPPPPPSPLLPPSPHHPFHPLSPPRSHSPSIPPPIPSSGRSWIQSAYNAPDSVRHMMDSCPPQMNGFSRPEQNDSFRPKKTRIPTNYRPSPTKRPMGAPWRLECYKTRFGRPRRLKLCKSNDLGAQGTNKAKGAGAGSGICGGLNLGVCGGFPGFPPALVPCFIGWCWLCSWWLS